MIRVTGDWAETAPTQSVMQMLTGAGHLAYFVGGCVRNALLGVPVADVDISTDARPERVMELAQDAGFRAIPTGIDHGTVTVVAGGVPHEITTFRRDIATDGRRAVVAFADRVEDDARRRDFTMNALYAAADGIVVDPLGGVPDLQARLVRFIEDPGKRIREDYLRILRFFRFHAWYGAAGIDAEGLAACAEHAEGLETLSKERIGTEMLKLLAAPDPAPAMASFQMTGGLYRILPGADSAALAVLVHLEGARAPDPIRRLALIGGEDPVANLRLSRQQARELDLLATQVRDMTGAAELAYRFGSDTAENIMLIRSALMSESLPRGLAQDLERGTTATFPISHTDLPGHTGKALGDHLRQLEQDWIASGFALTKPQLLDRIK